MEVVLFGANHASPPATEFKFSRSRRVGQASHRFRERQVDEEEQMRRAQAAQNRIQRGQVSRARQELTGAALAPKNRATLGELRHQRPQTQLPEIPPAVLEAQPPRTVTLDHKILHSCLLGSPSGVAPGPGGCTNEMLRFCLDDAEILLLLFDAAEDFARGRNSRQCDPVFDDDCPGEAWWRSQVNCNRYIVPQTRREGAGPSVQQASGTGLRYFSNSRCPREQGLIAWVPSDSCVVQFAQHNVARTSKYPVAHGQDTHVELRRRAPCRHGGSWTRCVEPRRYQDLGNPCGASCRRAKIVGRHPFSAGPAM